jgi:hypothetical protein
MAIELKPVEIGVYPAISEGWTERGKQRSRTRKGPGVVLVRDSGIDIWDKATGTMVNIEPEHIDALIGALVEARAVGRHLYGHGSK